jgi:hypothetical protein
MPYSALAEQGHVYRPDTDEYEVFWLEKAILQHENFPPTTNRGKDDIVDSCSGAINYLRGNGSLDYFTAQDADETSNAVEQAPRGIFRQEREYSESDHQYHSGLPTDNDDLQAPWER